MSPFGAAYLRVLAVENDSDTFSAAAVRFPEHLIEEVVIHLLQGAEVDGPADVTT